MSINIFFILILTLLVGMFSYFKPLKHDQLASKEVPSFELDKFVIYEISPERIDRFFEGEHGKRFSDRYEVSDAKFTNNEKALLESIRANSALYKDDVITLEGKVYYARSDGLQFHSNEGMYDQKRSFLTTEEAFTITKNENSIEGRHLLYDLNLDTVSADQIRASYQLK
ncbi:MAG: LPS export ABC transporter periplasmic protein LptC [Pseudomonadota bacterium]